MPERFRIVFLGLSRGCDRDEAVTALAEAFGVERSLFESLVSRAPVTVKRGVDQATASSFQHAIMDAGGRCRVELDLEPEPMLGEKATTPREPSPPPASPSPVAPVVAAAGPTCPKCGYQRQPRDPAPDYECPRCGIVYAKFHPRVESASPLAFAGPTGVLAARRELAPDQKLCPFCAEPIQAAAIKCKHCGEHLGGPTHFERPTLADEPTLSDYEAERLLSQGTWTMAGAIALALLARVLLLGAGLDETVQNTGWFIIKRLEPNGFGKFCIGLTFLAAPISIWGAYQIVRSKSRHWALASLGLLSLVGLAILRALKDRYASSRGSAGPAVRPLVTGGMGSARPAVRPLADEGAGLASGGLGDWAREHRRVVVALAVLVGVVLVGLAVDQGVKGSRRSRYRRAVAELDENLGVDNEVRFARSLQDLKDLIAMAAGLVSGSRWSSEDVTEFVSTADERLQRFLERARAQLGPTGRVHGQPFTPLVAELCDGMRRATASVHDPEARLRLAQRAGQRTGLCTAPDPAARSAPEPVAQPGPAPGPAPMPPRTGSFPPLPSNFPHPAYREALNRARAARQHIERARRAQEEAER